MGKSKKLIVIVGPTASGKTALALEKALEYKTEIVSADSRQIYQELNIGVARPSKNELNTVPHHLIAHTSIHIPYDVRQYEMEALHKLKSIFLTNDVALLVGGTGLYINAVLYGMDEIPDVDVALVEELNYAWQEDRQSLLDELLQKDPSYFYEVDPYNSRRIVRALSVIRQTNKPFSDFRTGIKVEREFDVEITKLIPEREELYARINDRVDQMIIEGLEEEAFTLNEYRHLKALDTVGYKEWWPYFDGKTTKVETIEKIKQHTRNYAKRQITWWRKY
jgi:tRNA dimethylallyltransferase